MIIIIICVFFPDTQWCIVDIAQLNGLLGEIRCPTCEATKLSFSARMAVTDFVTTSPFHALRVMLWLPTHTHHSGRLHSTLGNPFL